MEEQGLYPEEQMMIEQAALEAFLFAAEYENQGIDHLISVLNNLKERMNADENHEN